MALCHFPSLFTFPHKLNNPHLKWGIHQHSLHKNLIFASSAEKSRKKGRVTKAGKSNEDLCNDLREFISAAGLPENHVPTMKELSENGRKDLANIVRRRGYKVVSELLRNSFKNDNDSEKSSTEEGNFSITSSEETSEVQVRNLIEPTESFSSPSSSSMLEKYMVKTNDAIAPDTSVQVFSSSEPNLSLHSRAANFVQTGNLDIFEAYVGSQEVRRSSQQIYRDQVITERGLEGACNDENFASEMDGEMINQAEIDQLKGILRQKEVELLELKQQIEKEKQALYTLQDKANKEIFNTQRMETEKDRELRAAEESLSGLKEVQIEYWGKGETVEVAGSFNGWHNRIKMDQHTSSEQLEPLSRSLKLWSTILWLYPGIYEIKFIIDGTWKVDPNREMSTSCNITNNILRVDR